jgi:Glycosyltransferase
MNVFVFATMGEGFGMPPIEAAALSRPVVVSATPVIEELWGDYPLLVRSRPVLVSEGFVLHATDYEDLSRKMFEAAFPERGGYYGRVARRVAENYTARRMAESFLKLVDLAQQKRGVKKPHPLSEYKANSLPRDVILEVLGLI